MIELSIESHYRTLLGIEMPWEVSGVETDIEDKKVEITLVFTGEHYYCPKCGNKSRVYDYGVERSWRHLDTMQFETVLRCEVPRVNCKQDGVKTVSVPWAEKHSRFTLLFEGFALQILQACSSIKGASQLLDLNWHHVDRLMKRAVARGLVRRRGTKVQYVSIDEKQFRGGHDYVSILTDIGGSRVLEVQEGRELTAARALLESGLTSRQRKWVDGIGMDMWVAYRRAAEDMLPNAAIVHDRFHVSRYLNNAVNDVRKNEHRVLLKAGRTTLVKTKYWWLSNEENVKEAHQAAFNDLKGKNLKTARAWGMKELFRCFWDYQTAGWAKRFFDRWYSWAIRSRLAPMKKVAKTLKAHLDNLLTWFKHPISSASSEGMNSKIQSIKANARGLRSFASFRTRILFYCGKLDFMPRASQ